jgi:hypothetical protein
VLEGLGGDKIRIDSTSLDRHLVILADQALEIGRSQKSPSDPDRASAYRLNHDAVGMAEGWLRAATK